MKSETCSVEERELWELADDSVDAGSEDLRAHAAGCPRCRARLAEFERVRAGLEGITDATAIPAEVGPYRVLRVLGQGAAGVVYEAQQSSPDRRVALKVLRPLRQFDADLLRSFKREVQALARLDHPAIVPIYDAGRTQEGLPYFAMRLVEGRSIERYCAEERVSMREKARLVADLARAVHFAHQRGILHRDLKPAHAIVDAEEALHVLDFGLARPLHDEAGISFSLSGNHVVGTLRYMSPEQARGDDDSIDTRTDVYALGVILYELLTGEPPYELPHGLVEAARVIEQRQPAHPRRVAPDVPKELGDIAMKALAKEVDRRYDSTAALAEDLERFLVGDAISARPSTRAYQLRVFTRRHRLLAGSTAVTMVVLLASVSTTLLSLFEVGRKHREAEQSIDYLTAAIRQLDPLVSANPDPKLRDVVDDLARNFAEGGGFGPSSLAEARLRTTIGVAYRNLDEPHLAEPHLREALAIHRSVLKETDEPTLRSRYELALALARKGAAEIPEVRDVLDEGLAALGSRRAGANLTLAAILRLRGTYAWFDDLETAERLLEEAEPLAAAAPPSLDREIQWSWIFNQLGILETWRGNPLAAEAHDRRALEIRRRLPAGHPHLNTSLAHLSRALFERGRTVDQEEALALSEETARLYGLWGLLRYSRGAVRAHARRGELARAVEVALGDSSVARRDSAGAITVQDGGVPGDLVEKAPADFLEDCYVRSFLMAAHRARGEPGASADEEQRLEAELAAWTASETPPNASHLTRLALEWFSDVAVCVPEDETRNWDEGLPRVIAAVVDRAVASTQFDGADPADDPLFRQRNRRLSECTNLAWLLRHLGRAAEAELMFQQAAELPLPPIARARPGGSGGDLAHELPDAADRGPAGARAGCGRRRRGPSVARVRRPAIGPGGPPPLEVPGPLGSHAPRGRGAR